MIGRCSKMQMLSWDQEIGLCDGIPYDIDFLQDFSRMSVHGFLLTNASAADLIKAIDYLAGKTASPSAGYFPQKDNGRYDEEMSPSEFALLIEKVSKQIDREEKWEKRCRKVKAKDANHNFDLICEDLLGDLYYE